MSGKQNKSKKTEDLLGLSEEIIIEKPKRRAKKTVVLKPEPEPEPESEPEPEPQPEPEPEPEIPKPKFKPMKKHEENAKTRTYVMTPARLEGLKKAHAKLKERNAYFAEQKAIQEEADRKVMEEKLIKKAIALKKKQLKKEAVIDEIPEDVPLRPRPKPMETVPKYKYY